MAGGVESLDRRTEHRAVAKVSRRVVAWLIDVGLLALVVFIGAIVLAAVVGPTVRFRSDLTTSEEHLVIASRRMVIVSALVSTSLSGAYSAVPWLVWGGSPGQLLLGLRVRSEHGVTLTSGQAIARWLLLFPPVGTVVALVDEPSLAALLWGSVPIWYLFLFLSTVRHEKKQGVHDRIAGTVVCRSGIATQ
jgi:uncharacterized RDD family membrane protein YckC